MGDMDREEIVSCLHRLARGIDRLDDELILSAYHPDAVDCHGAVFQGGPEEYVDWLRRSHVQRPTSQHFLTNINVDLDGDVAHVETYFMAPLRRADDPGTLGLACGRYVDRFERRAGAWRIAVRVVITESLSEMPASPVPELDDTGRRDPSDVSYARPLTAVLPPPRRASSRGE